MAVYNEENGFYARDSQLPFIPGILPSKIERHYMSPLRFFVNYRVVPGFLVLCGLALTAILILMSIDDEKYFITAIILFSFIGISCMLLLLSVPIVRKLEIAAEIKRYNFIPLSAPLENPWLLDDEDVHLQFSSNGLTINGEFYWYNHLSPRLATSNRFNRIWLALQFGADPLHSVFIPLSPKSIAAVDFFSIPLQNKEAFDFLLSHKEKVFEEIYKTGSFRISSVDV